MQTTISQDQNAQKQLERLAAQRYMYSSAKRFLAIQLILDLSSPILLAIIVAFFSDFGVYAAFITLLVAVADLLLESLQSAKRQQAAGVQELFDCELFNLTCPELIQRNIPDTMEIIEAAEKYRRHDATYADLKNWYSPEVDHLPLYLARLVCQRINCYWDGQLRHRYIRVIYIAFAILCTIVAVLALIKGITIGYSLVIMVIPLLPAIIWVFRETRQQSEAAKEKDALKQYADNLWRDAIKKHTAIKEIECKSRELQDHIYHNRSSNPLVLDIFYRHLLPKDEVHMNRSAEELVTEALQNLNMNKRP